MINKMKQIIKNSLFKNSIIVFLGETVNSIILMVVSVMVVKEIGFEKYGVMTIALTYIGVFNILFNFQSFNAVIKFGHEAIAKNDKYLLKSYFKQAFLQDIFSAILAFIAGLLLLNVISDWFEWDGTIKNTISIFLISIPFNISGSVIGIIRLFNKFSYLSIISVISALIKLFLVIIGMVLNYDFNYFVLIELCILLISSVFKLVAGFIVAKNNDFKDFLFVQTKWDMNFLKFNIYNNIVSTLDLPVGEFTKIFIAHYLGVSEVGIYNILSKVGNIFHRLTGPISVVSYPELSKYVSKNDIHKAISLTKRITFFSFSFGCLFLLIQYILFPFGGEYIFEGTVSKFVVSSYFLYAVISASVVVIHQLFIAMNYVKYNIYIIISANSLYLIVTPLLMKTNGVFGLIQSLIFQALIVIAIKIILLRKGCRSRC